MDIVLVEKIKKLLEMARRGGTEAEMELALSKVHELLAKYNLSLVDVEAHSDKEQTSKGTDLVWGNQTHQIIIWNAVSRLYFCFYYKQTIKANKKRGIIHTVIGKPSNIVVVKNMAAYVVSLCDNLAKNLPGSQRSSFKKGFASRIDHRVQEELYKAKQNKMENTETGTSLVLRPVYDAEERESKEYLKSQGIKTKSGSCNLNIRDRSGFQAGQEAAENVSLKANGITGKSQNLEIGE